MRSVPGAIESALALTHRKISYQVLVTDEERDISSDVSSVSLSFSEEWRANTASLTVANENGKYDQLIGGAESGYLKQNTKIKIKAGYSDVLIDAFTGWITKVSSVRYKRGSASTLNVQCVDLSKPFYKQEISTDLYANRTPNSILVDPEDGVFTHYGNWDGATNLAGGDIDFNISRIQWMKEHPMDIAHQLMQTKDYIIWFDYSGTLTSKKRSSTDVPCATIEGTFISSLEGSWSDEDIINTCVVLGALQGTRTELGEEKLIGTAFLYRDYTGRSLTQTIEYSLASHPVDPDTVRIVVKDKQSVDSVKVLSTESDSITVKMWPKWAWAMIVFPWFSASCTVEVYGKEIITYSVYYKAEAQDSTLYEEYGNREIKETIENPAIVSNADALTLAMRTIQVASWFRYRYKMVLPYDPRFEPTDVISVYHPDASSYLKLYVHEVRHSLEREAEPLTTLDCAFIELI